MAIAGEAQQAWIGDRVWLDGARSLGDGYRWTLVERPLDSDLTSNDISHAASNRAWIRTEVPGSYLFSLEVCTRDGLCDSDELEVRIIQRQPVSGTNPPVANAGADQTASVGQQVVLQGSAEDPDLTEPTVWWRFYSVPSESQLITQGGIAARGTLTPSFRPDAAGEFVLILYATDNFYTDTDTVSIFVVDNYSQEFGVLEDRVEALEDYIDELEALLTVEDGDLVVTGANLHLRSGTGATDGQVNGTGNLIIGYDEDDGNDKFGSHNLIIGGYHSYGSYGGLVAGEDNSLDAPHASVTGGYSNTASGAFSVISGGRNNVTYGDYATISGGQRGTVLADYGSISGGYNNDVSVNAEHGSILGGEDNEVNGLRSTISGGFGNYASGDYSAIAGGESCNASGEYSAIAGGQGNTASGDYSAIAGGQGNTASGEYSTVAGESGLEAGNTHELKP